MDSRFRGNDDGWEQAEIEIGAHQDIGKSQGRRLGERIKLSILGVFATLALFAAIGAHAQSAAPGGPDQGLLPFEQAFKLSTKIEQPGTLALHWDIAQEYYLYRERTKAKTAQAGVALGALALPAGERKHDEYLGDVEVYHHAIDATLPYTFTDASAKTLAVTLTVQGCHETDPKICYPPTPVTVTLDLPLADANATGHSAPTDAPASPLTLNLGGTSSSSLSDASAMPLPAERAFVFETIAQSPTELLARWTMPKGYYLYRDKSVITLVDGDGVKLGAPRWPAAIDHNDEHFGTVQVYFDQVELPIPLARERGDKQTITVHAEYQGCQDNGICYPVMTHDAAVSLPTASAEQLAAAQAAFASASTPPPATADDNAQRTRPPAASTLGIAGALLFALLGGLVLNLMPCVLPVLSLKVFGLLQSGESAQKARHHAIWYTAGVLISFTAVGGIVFALRTAGHALGWGFQLQQPLFVAVLVYLLFAIGLSLSGMFNINIGFAGAGHALSQRSGPVGDFFTGVLAVVVASPCTVPFMASALAFAFTAPILIALLIFIALGFGLALPFLLIGFVPALAARLPKPGAWMETLKQLLAFPMYLTAVWLLRVLGGQRGVDAIAWVLCGAVVLALGLWWWERNRYREDALRHALAIVALLIALLPLVQIARLAAPTNAQAKVATDDAVPYSAQRLAALRAQGRGVFVDMGADWCVTCKLNEKAVLDTDTFHDLLKRNNTVLMTGDWTNVDPAITAFLQEYDAVGVPLYVVFRAGESGPGHALPAILTQRIIEDALVPVAH
ncbi:MAG: protein-disulfide reductase DsbD [Rhodanobacter sp.]|jgi:thiol:disulfide interchange protein DsbD|nr:protein-disulfide reductase DsbD [Rhodanobacter sp.]